MGIFTAQAVSPAKLVDNHEFVLFSWTRFGTEDPLVRLMTEGVIAVEVIHNPSTHLFFKDVAPGLWITSIMDSISRNLLSA
jgi:hypothetical protein